MEDKEKDEKKGIKKLYFYSWRRYCLIMKMNLRAVGNWVANILFKSNYR